MNNGELISELLRKIKDNPEQFSLIAQQWTIFAIDDYPKSKGSKLNFGKYGSSLRHSYPFYKAFSRVIDPSILK